MKQNIYIYISKRRRFIDDSSRLSADSNRVEAIRQRIDFNPRLFKKEEPLGSKRPSVHKGRGPFMRRTENAVKRGEADLPED